MVTLKSKIKLSYKIFILLIFINSYLFSQGYFQTNNSNQVYSFSGNYLKHKDFNDYEYGFKFSMLFKGNTQIDFNYSKINDYILQNSTNSTWEEEYSLLINYFIKTKRSLHFVLNTKAGYNIRSNSPLTSHSFTLNTFFIGVPGTGMKYYPYMMIIMVMMIVETLLLVLNYLELVVIRMLKNNL